MRGREAAISKIRERATRRGAEEAGLSVRWRRRDGAATKAKAMAMTESDGDGENGRWRGERWRDDEDGRWRGRAMARRHRHKKRREKRRRRSRHSGLASRYSRESHGMRGLWGRGCLLYSLLALDEARDGVFIHMVFYARSKYEEEKQKTNE